MRSCPGGELIGGAGPPQGRQYVELPRLQLVLGERQAPGPVKMTRQPADPTEHLEGLHVEVRALSAPRCDQPVDLVLHDDQSSGSLDMKSLEFNYLDIEINSGGS